MTDDGKLAEENNTAAELIKTYNNNLTLTRDKLPDFTHLASSIKDTEEKSAESKKDEEIDSLEEASALRAKRTIVQRLTARRRKKILLKQNRKRPLREFSAAFLYPIYLSTPQKASASQALHTLLSQAYGKYP